MPLYEVMTRHNCFAVSAGKQKSKHIKTQYNGQEVARQDIKIPRSMCTAVAQRLAFVAIGNCLMLNFIVIS